MTRQVLMGTTVWPTDREPGLDNRMALIVGAKASPTGGSYNYCLLLEEESINDGAMEWFPSEDLVFGAALDDESWNRVCAGAAFIPTDCGYLERGPALQTPGFGSLPVPAAAPLR